MTCPTHFEFAFSLQGFGIEPDIVYPEPRTMS